MSARRFFFTREAIRSWQKFPADVQARLKAALGTLEPHGIHIKKLENSECYRKRVGNYRIIWRPGDRLDERFVLRVAWRDENTYRRPFPRAVDHDLAELADDVDKENIGEVKKLAYQLEGLPSQVSEQAWRGFIGRGYRLTPRLSAQQRSSLESFFLNWDGSDPCPIIQCGPGSGKTLCAVQAIEEYFQQETAAQVHRYAALLVPSQLAEDLRKHPSVCKIGSGNHFFLGTFDEWLRGRVPELEERTISEQEELDALQVLVRGGGQLTREDLAYFQARMARQMYAGEPWSPLLNEEKEVTIAGDNTERRQWINDIRIDDFRRLTAPSGRLTRAEVPKYMFGQMPVPPGSSEILLVVDEAQERLLAELVLIKKIADRWKKQRRTVRLILLGDLNQRISPTGYDWGHLGKSGYRSTEDCFVENYRNSRAVLTFAVQLWHQLQSETRGGRNLPKPPAPGNAVDTGGSVRRLVYASYEEAMDFLDEANRRCASNDDGTYILRKLANRIPVFCQEGVSRSDYPNLLLLPAHETKGREFGSAIVFCLFRHEEAWSQRLFEWYTVVTRVESHLLLVMTAEEEKELERYQHIALRSFPRLDPTEAGKAIDDVRATASEADLRDLEQNLFDQLLDACRKGRPYLDTYETLAAWEVGAIEDFEARAAAAIARWDKGLYEAQCERVREIAMKCLILRAAGRSWESAAAARAAHNSGSLNDEDYRRHIVAAANQLKSNNLNVEASRLRHFYAEQEWPSKYESLGLAPGRPDESLESLLRQAFLKKKKEFQEGL